MNNHTLREYQEVVGQPPISQLQQLAAELEGTTVVHVNSTREGGGVAEILSWKVPLMNELGLIAAWEVIEGDDEFFKTTKAFHNGLQGNPVALTAPMIEAYESVLTQNAERIRPLLEEADFVFIHDPQPAFLINLCPHRRGKWFWRCHIDASRPNRKTWSYLRSIVNQFDASIFSMPAFAQRLDHPQFIIAPSIDPLSDKNCALSNREIDSTLEHFGIPDDIPLLTQVSRFDRFKDPVGVIEAFKMLNGSVDARLVLAGGGATDDPEGVAVFEEVKDAAAGSDRIHLLMLPADAHRTINALQ